MFSTYRPHLRNRAYLWTHLPVCCGEMTSLPTPNHATSHWLTLAAVITLHEPDPVMCQGEQKATSTAVLQQSRVGSVKSVMKRHP